MKKFTSDIIAFALIALFASYFLNSAYGACPSISRTNFGVNSVLTSTELNSQFNAVYGAANDLDGECITTGSLPVSAADSTWGSITNHLQSGCKVSYSNASTVSVSKCALAVNGNFVSTTSATTVSFGCTGCSGETAGTYYVYAADGSSGTTLTLKILTTAPNEDGYDASNNRVLGRFYNNQSNDIDQYSLDQWKVNSFEPQNSEWISFSPTLTNFGTVSTSYMRFRRQARNLQIRGFFIAGTIPAGQTGSFTLPNNMYADTSRMLSSSAKVNMVGFWIRNDTGTSPTSGYYLAHVDPADQTKVYLNASSSNTNFFDNDNSDNFGSSEGIVIEFEIPILGWGY